MGKDYDVRSDVWSLGATLYGCYVGEVISENCTEVRVAMDICTKFEDGQEYFKGKCAGRFDEKLSVREAIKSNAEDDPYGEAIYFLLMTMLTIDPAKRPLASEILEMEIFKEFTPITFPEIQPERKRLCIFDNAPSTVIPGHPDLRSNMYKILVEWLGDVQKSFYSKRKLPHLVYLVGIDILNRYMAVTKNIKRSEFQKIGISCYYLASILFDDVIFIQDCFRVCDKAFSEKEISLCTEGILNALDFDVVVGYDCSKKITYKEHVLNIKKALESPYKN